MEPKLELTKAEDQEWWSICVEKDGSTVTATYIKDIKDAEESRKLLAQVLKDHEAVEALRHAGVCKLESPDRNDETWMFERVVGYEEDEATKIVSASYDETDPADAILATAQKTEELEHLPITGDTVVAESGEEYLIGERISPSPETKHRNCPNCGASLFVDLGHCISCGRTIDEIGEGG